MLIPFLVITICFRFYQILWALLASRKRKKNTRKAVKRSVSENFKESVGGSCYPRGDLQPVCPSFNELSWGRMRGEYFLNQGCVRPVRMCLYRATCLLPLLLPIDHSQERTSTCERTGTNAQTIGRVPIANVPSKAPDTHGAVGSFPSLEHDVTEQLISRLVE